MPKFPSNSQVVKVGSIIRILHQRSDYSEILYNTIYVITDITPGTVCATLRRVGMQHNQRELFELIPGTYELLIS